MVTQPLMYKSISKHAGTRKLYAESWWSRVSCSRAKPRK